MVGFLGKLLYLVIFAILVMYFYYAVPSHKETFTGYTAYVIVMLFYYILYKGYNYIADKKQIAFSGWKIFLLFLLQLFSLTIIFFILSGSQGGLGFALFFKIIGYLILPIFITLISISFGKFILKKIPGFSEETNFFQFLTSLGLGFSLMLIGITLLGMLGGYNIGVLLSFFILLGGISYKELGEIFSGFFKHEFLIDDHNYTSNNFFEKINFHLLTTEFFFIVMSFLLSVNLINIVRPMPIGWDDLGVYMNYPNMMANAHDILNLGGMYTWQIFTGIGFLFSNSTQAFFLNSFAGILSIIVIILAITDLLQSKKKTFLNIPFMMATIYLAMPMVIFQLAKDMKLDSGVFFLSTIVVYMLLYLLLKYVGYKEEVGLHGESVLPEKESQEQKKTSNLMFYFTHYKFIGTDIFSQKKNLVYLLIIGCIAGVAFTIKLTSLLLISGLIGMIFYAKLGVSGFSGYVAFYIAIFTKADLWKLMNVIIPSSQKSIDMIFIGGLIISLILWMYGFKKYGYHAFKKVIVLVSIFLLGVLVGVFPWFVKNALTVENLSIGSLLSGTTDAFQADYTKIYPQQELDTIKETIASGLMTQSGTSVNEDMGRYLGYDTGMNNYLKLPFNLTMQVNQTGEYTDITFIYLALLPLLLFLAYKNVWFSRGVFAYLLIPLFFFFISGTNTYLSSLIGNIIFPAGYLLILIFFLIPFLFVMYALKHDKMSVLFRLNLVFGAWYVFLWTISSFGIVWYGIVMYFNFLLGFAIALYYMTSYDEKDTKAAIIKMLGSVSVFLIVATYIFGSTFPHGFKNLQEASYLDFKSGQTNTYISIFEAHPTYFTILVELNILREKQTQVISSIFKELNNPKMVELAQSNNINNLDLLNQLFLQIRELDDTADISFKQLKKDAVKGQTLLYKTVLYPSVEYKNTAGVYRIGTFLRYFTVDNYKRFFEDSLIFEFHNYMYDHNNLDLTIERMKKLGLQYFLVDLNAATIDKDPARNLTKRYEELLHTFTSDKLELIQTDSICLRLALEDYTNSQKTPEDYELYLKTAGVNYESYTSSGQTIARGEKLYGCYNKILTLMNTQGAISEQKYSYLIPLVKYINENKITSEEELGNVFRSYISQGWLVLFRIKD